MQNVTAHFKYKQFFSDRLHEHFVLEYRINFFGGGEGGFLLVILED